MKNLAALVVAVLLLPFATALPTPNPVRADGLVPQELQDSAQPSGLA
ncbi:hypothetical protein NCU05763 [Neurospora crassa OR74A]|uniref:Uncharacterized protein n=1 Tax=Neurospora crassa (strain ATCC 24698 / 74-OR23-1A / CBS 708.71 / DSM 1257 / FGSC 987) TaxID=367110 RepID=Q7S4R0_NEUCR|nr:hypothetical protein NCU05763 [Neurospora crassa OR74A]EAA30502.2 hypothetical protein NCU05763 [Neurospora crassa OR74A]|eukprot:XP_959738.2 hypothetical protein NCU05763 [Neurospora crassa OR74A]